MKRSKEPPIKRQRSPSRRSEGARDEMAQQTEHPDFAKIVTESEPGTGVLDLCRKHGISDSAFYKWKARYVGMKVAEIDQQRELKTKYAKLRMVVAHQAREISALRILLTRTR